MTPDELADRLEQAAEKVGPAIQRHMRHAGALGVGKIKANASGRPGPMVRNTEEPNYRDSWKDVYQPLPYGALCTLGTTKPQGRRLEFGFYNMRDSLGRLYFQEPFPHVDPALSFIGAVLREQMGNAIDEVIS